MIRRAPVTGLALLFTCVALGSRNSDDANKSDLAALQGEWQMISGETGGMQFPAESAKTGKRICKGDQVTVTFGGMMIMKATIMLDATKNPKTIDYKLTDGPNKGKTQLGIYELKDDTFKSCFAAPDHERPTEFETKPGDGRTLSVWKKL
jgi:uncharacterized protein (TIGR03067 family)